MFAWRPSEFSGAINASISDRAACILDSVSAQLIFRALSVEATKKTLECVKRRNRRNVWIVGNIERELCKLCANQVIFER